MTYDQVDGRVWWAAGIVAAICIAAVVWGSVKAIHSSSGASTPSSQLAPASLVSAVTGVSSATFTAVGQGSVASLPIPITAPSLTESGLPEVFYAGAEYCPFCAAERWPVIVALSRFGAFSNLGVSHSSATDSYPNTQTFSFHGSTYTSRYLAFTGVETLSNQPQGDSYAPLDSLNPSETSLVNTYDASPYLPTADAGSIPFIDFGGKYLVSGAAYSPSTLQGKTAAQIAAALQTASDPIAQGIIGEANVLTATICSLTGNQPAAVCSAAPIPSLEQSLTAQKPS